MSNTSEHDCMFQVRAMIRQVANPVGILMGTPPRLQQAWQCAECGTTTWRDVEIVSEEEAAK